MAPALSVPELTLLFAGDDDCRACPSPQLVAAICEQAEPRSSRELLFVMFGTYDADEFDTVDLLAIEAGYGLWRKNRVAAA